jgi:hypothetical protein
MPARILVVQLFGDLAKLLSSAAMIAHQDNIPEAILDQLFANLLIQIGEQRGR